MKHQPIPTGTVPGQPAPAPHRAPQVGALCLRAGPAGLEVLLITSRDTGRWIIPKGWPMSDRSDADAAMQEAWEEAGVVPARFQTQPLGFYDYDKRGSGGTLIAVTVAVYRAEVESLADEFPECDERTRRWVRPGDAARMVDEPGLREILRAL